jgi:hypothetical protein
MVVNSGVKRTHDQALIFFDPLQAGIDRKDKLPDLLDLGKMLRMLLKVIFDGIAQDHFDIETEHS